MRSPLLLSTTLWAARLYSSRNLPAGWTQKIGVENDSKTQRWVLMMLRQATGRRRSKVQAGMHAVPTSPK